MNATAENPTRLFIMVIFAVTYLGIAIGRVPGLKLNRVGIVLLGAIAVMLLGGVTTSQGVSYVNWPTIVLLFSFFVISAQLRLSGFYDKVASGISKRSRRPGRFMFEMMAVTAGLSAFLNHDIVCFVFTPIVGASLLRERINPVPFLIALAIASNIGAAATLIGNPQNMVIGSIARLNFGAYLAWSIIPVLVAFGGAYGVIRFLSRRQLALAQAPEHDAHPREFLFNRPHTIKGLVILVLVVGLLFTSLPKELVALAAAGVHLASPKFDTDDLLGLVDWPILVLFLGLFVLTGAFQSTGYGERAARWLTQSGFNPSDPANLALTTAVFSNLIGNSAAVLLLLKTVDLSRASSPYVLALANSFGGCLIVIGSISNIIVVQQARELGVTISFRSFARFGVPTTLVALTGLMGWVLLAG